MGKTRIVIDTNVLISAFGWFGKSREIFEQVLSGNLELIISEKQFAEIQRVLTYPKLKFTAEEQAGFLDILKSVALIVETHHRINMIKEDPSDNMLLETAFEYHASHIISGDQHVLNVKKIHRTCHTAS